MLSVVAEEGPAGVAGDGPVVQVDGGGGRAHVAGGLGASGGVGAGGWHHLQGFLPPGLLSAVLWRGLRERRAGGSSIRTLFHHRRRALKVTWSISQITFLGKLKCVH